MKKLTSVILALSISLLGIFAALPTASTYAKNTADTNVCNKSGVSEEVLKAAGCKGDSKQLPDVVSNILIAIIGVLGLVAVVFVVIGGINYMTSGGDAGKLKTAKNTILYALIGLIICALAFAIVNWVIGGVLKQESDGAIIISKTLLI